MLGVHKKWGYTNLNISDYFANVGLIEGDRDSATGDFIDHFGNTVSAKDLQSRLFRLPFQEVEHRKISSRTHLIGKESHLDILAGWQQNIRAEFEDSYSSPALRFDLNTYTLDVNFHWPRTDGWEHVFGMNSMFQMNRSAGEEILLPEYDRIDAGLFYFIKKTLDKSTFSMGIRYSYRNLKIFDEPIDSSGAPDPNGSLRMFSDTTHHFKGPAFSIGFTQKLKPHISLKNAISSGFRAPNAFELYAFGVHEGTQRFEFGNSSMKQEISLQYDLGWIIEKKKVHWEPAFFVNYISNYISLQRLGSGYYVQNGDTLESYGFFQTGAVLYGAELTVDWHPRERLHIQNVFSWVEGMDTRSSKPLSMIPPPRIVSDFRYEFKDKSEKERWKAAYVKLSADLNFEQYRLAFFEEHSDLYCLLHFGAGITRSVKGNDWKMRLNVQNVLNQEYAPHLSRMRYLGVMNMGRNFTFSLDIPFGLKKG